MSITFTYGQYVFYTFQFNNYDMNWVNGYTYVYAKNSALRADRGFLNDVQIQTQTVILLCEQVFTIFLCIGEYVLIEIISFRITRCKLTEVTGPLVPLEILSHESESTLYVWMTTENRMDIFRILSATLLALWVTALSDKHVLWILMSRLIFSPKLVYRVRSWTR